MTNFDFLKKIDANLYEIIKEAEKLYTAEFFEQCMGQTRRFGEQMCKEIKEELIKNNELDSYKIIQIKEKFGGLRWYDNSGLPGMQFIIAKYEALSEKTCINCGKPANWISKGWISPYCDDCAIKQAKAQGVDINKTFKKIQED